MDSCKYEVKLFLQGASSLGLEAFVPVFHRWIQTRQLDEVLVDVADYRHVHHGPGVVLVCHGAHYAMDMAAGRMGLLYSRRREPSSGQSAPPSPAERLASVLRCALTAAQRLEAEASLQGRLRFRGDTWLLRLNDRLYPATPEAFDSLRSHLKPLLPTLYPGCDVAVEPVVGPDTRLTACIQAPDAPDVTTLLDRLGARARERTRESVQP
jgi:hypothetical protein